jgi:hypothetical protein
VFGETTWHKKLPAFITQGNTNFRCFSYIVLLRGAPQQNPSNPIFVEEPLRCNFSE